MDEVKILKSLAYMGVGFLIFYVLYNHVFEQDFGFFGFLLPVGTSIIGLAYKFAHIVQRRNKKGFVILKDTLFEFSDLTGSLLSVIIILYIKDDFLYWLIPLISIDLILIFLIKRKQFYYFGDWSLKNLSDTDKTFLIKNIQSYILHPNKLEVIYLKEENSEKEKLIIRREQLESPHSWYEFEKIAKTFEERIEAIK